MMYGSIPRYTSYRSGVGRGVLIQLIDGHATKLARFLDRMLAGERNKVVRDLLALTDATHFFFWGANIKHDDLSCGFA